MFPQSLSGKFLNRELDKILDKEDIQTPFILCCREQLAHYLNSFCNISGIPPSGIYFPVKVNHTPEVLRSIHDAGCNFEIASSGELQLLKNLNISGKRIMYSNPVKQPDSIAEASQWNISRYAFDTVQEAGKISEIVPDAEGLLRISVSNKGAAWKLQRKFGAGPGQAASLARQSDIRTAGVSFHAGWNNSNTRTWKSAVDSAEKVIRQLKAAGLSPEILNIGGGFPAHDREPEAGLREIFRVIGPVLNKLRDSGISILAEPGSAVAARSAVAVLCITDIIIRKNTRWVFADSGICQGFYWMLGGLKYRVDFPMPRHSGVKRVQAIITGPSCDSHDIIASGCILPGNAKPGDIFTLGPAGAYISSSVNYNGFSCPPTRLV